MAVTAQGLQVGYYILALAPAVDVVDILGPLATVLARDEAINTETEVFKVNGGVVLHGSLLLRCTINCSILAL